MTVAIVAAYNTQLEMTKSFLDTLQETTPEDVYMILVNGGNAVDIQHPFIDELIHLDTNEGFAPTINAGLSRVPDHCEYVFYVGNDSFPTYSGWLTDLVRLQAQTGAGLVCPANDRPGMQAYPHLLQYDKGDYWETHMFPSIAYLLTRECFKAVGLWDPLFARSGMYGDDDYCKRVVKAGYKIVVSKHILLRHLLSQEAPRLFDVGADMQENARRFAEKWQGQ